MKKFILILISIIAVCVFTACEEKPIDEPTKPGKELDEPQPIQLVRKWFYLGAQHDAEFAYDEQNYMDILDYSEYR